MNTNTLGRLCETPPNDRRLTESSEGERRRLDGKPER